MSIEWELTTGTKNVVPTGEQQIPVAGVPTSSSVVAQYELVDRTADRNAYLQVRIPGSKEIIYTIPIEGSVNMRNLSKRLKNGGFSNPFKSITVQYPY